jgi:hypothetical protein
MFRRNVGDTPNTLVDGDYKELAARAEGCDKFGAGVI